MVNHKEFLDNLNQFRSTEGYHTLNPKVVLTDGVKHLMETTQSYWIGDLVWSYQTLKNVAPEGFQVYHLKVNLKKNTAVVTCDDGNGNILKKQSIPFTDFPMKELKLYYVDNVLMLPSEY